MENTAQQIDTESVSEIMKLENHISSLLPKGINWNIILIVYAIILIVSNTGVAEATIRNIVTGGGGG